MGLPSVDQGSPVQNGRESPLLIEAEQKPLTSSQRVVSYSSRPCASDSEKLTLPVNFSPSPRSLKRVVA